MISQITMDQRRQLWLIFKEIITNIAKHSGCSSADITLRIPDPKTLMLEIRDNGQGFDPGKQTDRNGLKNINVRARALGATATVTSSPEEGTTWSITWVMQ